MPTNKIRTRFAPSPTGYMHVGNLRTALYAYLMAKHEDGTFILRIEDTDQGRYVEGAVDVIYNTLRETGLLWDEGPDIGGPVGPYVQSERMGMFKQYAEQLVAEGKAYYCFCTEERLEALHAEQRANGEMTHYDGCCRDLPEEEVKQRLAAGEPYVIRQKIPKEGVTGFDDVVYGHIEVENSEMDDQILIKTDGMPTYNFANVVDDHLMGITHVIRGSEYLSSTPKYNLLYQAFGWEIPTYIHCPPVMKDAQNKLSKRNGDASYQDLVAKGYLTEAILNYICLLGWSPKGEYAEQEIFSLADLVKIWTPDGISKSPAIFDPLKLRAINAEYIRRLSPEEFLAKAEPWIDSAVHTPIDKKLLCANLQPRCEDLARRSLEIGRDHRITAAPNHGARFRFGHMVRPAFFDQFDVTVAGIVHLQFADLRCHPVRQRMGVVDPALDKRLQFAERNMRGSRHLCGYLFTRNTFCTPLFRISE